VGVDEGNFFWGNGCGEEMLFLGAAVPEAGAEDLNGVSVKGPAVLVAALELEGAGGDADDIAVEVDHGAVGEGVDLDGAVAVLGFVFAFAGLEVDGAAGGGAAAQEQGEGEKQKEGFHVSNDFLDRTEDRSEIRESFWIE
jgi:hypothetical protein